MRPERAELSYLPLALAGRRKGDKPDMRENRLLCTTAMDAFPLFLTPDAKPDMSLPSLAIRCSNETTPPAPSDSMMLTIFSLSLHQ